MSIPTLNAVNDWQLQRRVEIEHEGVMYEEVCGDIVGLGSIFWLWVNVNYGEYNDNVDYNDDNFKFNPFRTTPVGLEWHLGRERRLYLFRKCRCIGDYLFVTMNTIGGVEFVEDNYVSIPSVVLMKK